MWTATDATPRVKPCGPLTQWRMLGQPTCSIVHKEYQKMIPPAKPLPKPSNDGIMRGTPPWSMHCQHQRSQRSSHIGGPSRILLGRETSTALFFCCSYVDTGLCQVHTNCSVCRVLSKMIQCIVDGRLYIHALRSRSSLLLYNARVRHVPAGESTDNDPPRSSPRIPSPHGQVYNSHGQWSPGWGWQTGHAHGRGLSPTQAPHSSDRCRLLFGRHGGSR